MSSQILTESFIQKLGQLLGAQWRQTAMNLKINQSEIKQITKENTDSKMAAICSLVAWNKNQLVGDEHKITLLKTALQKAKRQDLVNLLSENENLSLCLV